MSGSQHSESSRGGLAALVQRLLLVGALLLVGPVDAHKASDAYLFLAQGEGQTRLRWDIALRDLDAAMPLDADGDRQLTWGEVRAAWPAIDTLALAGIEWPGCRLAIEGHALERRADGAYAVLHLSTPCRDPDAAKLRYRLFADVDPTHRGILRAERADGRVSVQVLDPTAQHPADASVGVAAAADPVVSFLREGVHHILSGYDHVLFLLCLLLPAVLRREGGHWHAAEHWRQALGPVARTVTLFTLAHSVTLALGALRWVTVPAGVVEPAIAATIVLAALDNIRPVLLAWRGWVTFVFGLVHGFGFAGVLEELQLPAAAFGWALLEFNVGIELGQLAIVAVAVPLLWLLRRQRLYVPGLVVGGSCLAGVLAGAWVIERATDVPWLPF